MGRKRKLTLDFFILDADHWQSSGARLLRRKHGVEGYGAYLTLLQILCRKDGMTFHVDPGDESTLLAEDLGLRDAAHLHKFIHTCADHGLLDKQLWESERVVFSPELYDDYTKRLKERKDAASRMNQKRMEESLQKRIEALEDCSPKHKNCSPEQFRTIQEQNGCSDEPRESSAQQPTETRDRDLDPDPEVTTYSDIPLHGSGSSHERSPSPSSTQKGKSRSRAKGKRGRMKAETTAIYDRLNSTPDLYQPEILEIVWSGYCTLCKNHKLGSRAGSKASFVDAWCDLIDDGIEIEEIRAGCRAFAGEHKTDGSGIPQGHIFLLGKQEHPVPYWQAALDRKRQSEKPPPANDFDAPDEEGLATPENTQRILTWFRTFDSSADEASAIAYIRKRETPGHPEHCILLARLGSKSDHVDVQAALGAEYRRLHEAGIEVSAELPEEWQGRFGGATLSTQLTEAEARTYLEYLRSLWQEASA